MKIIVPSKGRHNELHTVKAIEVDAICVAESEAANYRNNCAVELMIHPDSIVGLGAKRQWIYDNVGDVCMIDDDIMSFSRLYCPRHRRKKRLLPSEAREVILATADMARQIGAFLFSIMPHGDTRGYYPQRPFRLTGYVNGAVLGMLSGSMMRFTNDVIGVNDYFVSGLNAYYHRYMFVDERFGFRQAKTFANPGGLATCRSHESEERDTDYLRQMFGDCVKRKTGNAARVKNRKIRAHRCLDIPF